MYRLKTYEVSFFLISFNVMIFYIFFWLVTVKTICSKLCHFDLWLPMMSALHEEVIYPYIVHFLLCFWHLSYTISRDYPEYETQFVFVQLWSLCLFWKPKWCVQITVILGKQILFFKTLGRLPFQFAFFESQASMGIALPYICNSVISIPLQSKTS